MSPRAHLTPMRRDDLWLATRAERERAKQQTPEAPEKSNPEPGAVEPAQPKEK